MQPPAQELVARDLHDTLWTFRHIYRGKYCLILLFWGGANCYMQQIATYFHLFVCCSFLISSKK